MKKTLFLKSDNNHLRNSVAFLLVVLVCLSCFMLGNREKLALQRVLLAYRIETALNNVDAFTVEAYYFNPLLLTRYPLRAEDVIRVCKLSEASDQDYVYDLYEGADCTRTLKQLAETPLHIIKDDKCMDARICFIIKNSRGKQLLEIVLQPTYLYKPVDTAFVSGIQVEYDDIFDQLYDELIVPMIQKTGE